MPPRPKPPETFDQHLGRVIDGAVTSYGGRPAVATWLGLADRSVERRMRGEVKFYVSELRVIAEHIKWPIEQIVDRALTNYGGIEKLLAESVSEPARTVTEEDNVTYLGFAEPPLAAAADEKPRVPGKD